MAGWRSIGPASAPAPVWPPGRAPAEVRRPRRAAAATGTRGVACSYLPSPHEELARRMVRAVNVGVAVHARSTEHPVALVGGDLVLVVERRRMLGRDVAALTEHRHPHDQHAIVRRAVRVMAGGAVLAHRGVFEQRRSAHLGMATGAAFGDGA